MYAVDEKDKVIECRDIPSPNTGAPLPMVIANEYRCVLAYEVSYDETRYAIAVFGGNFYFGGPNDEALRGHPLASRGLHAYAAFEVENSSWIRLMEIRNRIHPHHNPERFSKLKHIIITSTILRSNLSPQDLRSNYGTKPAKPFSPPCWQDFNRRHYQSSHYRKKLLVTYCDKSAG
jgi:hypothetical protein